LHTAQQRLRPARPAGGAATQLVLPRAPAARVVARPPPAAWTDHFALSAVVRVDGTATAAAALGEELAAVGDAQGRLYLFRRDGSLAADHATGARPGRDNAPLPRRL